MASDILAKRNVNGTKKTTSQTTRSLRPAYQCFVVQRNEATQWKKPSRIDFSQPVRFDSGNFVDFDTWTLLVLCFILLLCCCVAVWLCCCVAVLLCWCICAHSIVFYDYAFCLSTFMVLRSECAAARWRVLPLLHVGYVGLLHDNVWFWLLDCRWRCAVCEHGTQNMYDDRIVTILWIILNFWQIKGF